MAMRGVNWLVDNMAAECVQMLGAGKNYNGAGLASGYFAPSFISVSHSVSHLLHQVNLLSAFERVEFLAHLVRPQSKPESDWTEDDFSAMAAQSFARLDAEEEEDGRSAA